MYKVYTALRITCTLYMYTYYYYCTCTSCFIIYFILSQSVFHGPIHKKQDKDNGGKKPSDRSWRSLYAAIQKHWMVFYGSVQDALAVSHTLHVDNKNPLYFAWTYVYMRRKCIAKMRAIARLVFLKITVKQSHTHVKISL